MIVTMPVRWGWLKAMYILTIIVSGSFGLGMIFAPERAKILFLDTCDPTNYGTIGSVFLALGLLSILGLRDPLKFAPVLLLQLTYKVVWVIGVAIPLVIQGIFPEDEIITAVIFSVTIAGDLVAIPFSSLFSKRE